MSVSVVTEKELQGHIESILASSMLHKGTNGWMIELEVFLADVRKHTPYRLQDPDFLRRLWNENPVTSTGAGHVRIEPALRSEPFVVWFASEVSRPLPDDPVLVESHLIELYDGLVSRLRTLCDRMPWLKLNRVLCALYPEHFTTLSDLGRLKTLHRKLGGHRHDHAVQMHRAIRARTDRALQACAGQVSQVTQVCIPWLLYERLETSNTTESNSSIAAVDEGLSPLPALMRRKGLTSLGGGLQTLLALLPELNEGVTRDEFADLLRQHNPNLADNSIGTMINVISREFDLCKREGDSYQLTARGMNLLESQDPDEFADHLLTRVLGTDHLLMALAAGPKRKVQLIELLQSVNPGWTTSFTPSSIIGWFISLGLIVPATGKLLKLTERGQHWASMIDWVPEPLTTDAQEDEVLSGSDSDRAELPSTWLIKERLDQQFGDQLALDGRLVSELHAGLWSHPVRHFAVLSGISGSGKTQLALNYAQALCQVQPQDTHRIRVIPVQPGWYDPSPLLGYVSPIQESTYLSTPFLELLLQAADNPDIPFVAILDEMNLSHPEQYMAPILSAMETHGHIELHQLGDAIGQVPMRVRYPANLAIIGTLNMDETTHGLSDKVLDRAYTLEFWDIDVERFPGWSHATLPDGVRQLTRTLLTQLVQALEPVRLHFGWRTINDVLNYLVFCNASDDDMSALDAVVYAKVLPKLRGEHSPRFEKALAHVHEVLIEHGLARCEAKVRALREDLVETGSARYWR
ncbi:MULTISPECIES: McrB family protein [Pseudomonas]|uniref:McrB family protein n=1 Tax=Pseudomonas TaxID=286 RepID=UPI001E6038A1|nr:MULTISPECIES: hypothetical protein [Pseudomonas]MCE1117417.1 hypothetical protein [Pseudomonas sp. NMI795_08]